MFYIILSLLAFCFIGILHGILHVVETVENRYDPYNDTW